MRGPTLAALLVSLLIAGTPAHGELVATAPEYLCYDARLPRAAGRPGRDRGPDMAVTDRFASRQLSLLKPQTLCRQAPGEGALEGIGVELAHTRPRQRRRLKQSTEIVTRFGRQTVKMRVLDGLLLPAAASANPDGVLAPSASEPSFTCYGVQRGGRPKGDRPRVLIADVLGERLFDVRRPTRLCVQADPSGKAVLLCHAVELAGSGQPRSTRLLTFATSSLGTDLLRVLAPRELCTPGLETVIPTPGLTLELSPLAATAVGREHVAFTATAHLPTGETEDWTRRVVWTSSNEAVARIGSSSAAGAFVETLGPGTAVISATDPDTGVGSADANGNAMLTVTWPLEKLVLEPPAVTKVVGDDQNFTVTGIFTGGITRNLTPRVTYTSSEPLVVSVSTVPQRPSRVHAERVGLATISATDPVSGITTTGSGNDATVRVAPTFQFISIQGDDLLSSVLPGESRRLTATGFFADGSTRNFTQRCTWSSSDPAVAVATNPDGDRSRIDGLVPGFADITCMDARTGRTSLPLRLYVLGALQEISVYGSGGPSDWLENGEALRLTAIGRYDGGGQRNLTQQVLWTSRDPQIAITPNDAGDKSRVVAVGGGDARIFATDFMSGIVSNDAIVVALGDLLGLEILNPRGGPVVIGVGGGSPFLRVRRVYQDRSINVTNPSTYRLESSDPTIVEVVNDVFVAGRRPGTAEIRARHLATGLLSPPLTVKVRGDLESITLDPPTATRGIGEWESFTATGHYPPDFTENLTPFAVYSSSDPSVAVADNGRSRVRTVGPGTATITATAGSVSGTATLTVLPGTIERVTIEPPSIRRNIGNGFSFTAIGHYPDGSTINVTQVVTWATPLPDIAEATNEAGNRSRVVARTEGDTPVVALHPSGVSSHDTGDDAVFQSRPLVDLRLTPAAISRKVGEVERYTLEGEFADTTTINLSQDAYYWIDDPNVARADNDAGDRSAVQMKSPGTTKVVAVFADWSQVFYPITSGSVAGAFLSVRP